MTTHKNSRPLLAAFALIGAALAACGGDDPQPEQPDGAVDASPPGADARVGDPQSDIIGTWVPLVGELRFHYIFNADATFARTEDTTVEFSGTYELDGDSITLDSEDITRFPGLDQFARVRIAATYFLAGDTLSLSAYFPDGAVNGVEGAWRSVSVLTGMDADDNIVSAETSHSVFTFRGDGTYSLEFGDAVDGQEPVLTLVREGTYAVSGDDLVMDGSERLRIFGGDALGSDLHGRQ